MKAKSPLMMLGFIFAFAMAAMPSVATTLPGDPAPTILDWGGNGAQTCPGGAHWILSPKQGIASATLYAGGEVIPMEQNAEENGSWAADSNGAVTYGVTQVYVVYTTNGPISDKLKLKLSHCTGCIVDSNCDDQLTCTTDSCQLGRCTYENVVCDDGNTCTADSCEEPAGCLYTPDVGKSCGNGSETACDNPDTCDGNGNCVENHKPDTTVCRGSADICDVEEKCDGEGNCPSDDFLPSSTVCRNADGICDVPEYCTGEGAACPGDAFKPSTEKCAEATGECDLPEYCTGTSGACSPDGANKTDLCRGATGDCDVAEYCSDASDECPGDGVEPSTTQCRDANGICDEPEFCTGEGKECPADAFKPSTEKCADATGDCDLPEYCTGTSGACSPDGANKIDVCRPAKDGCDVAEYCSDASDECPSDGFNDGATCSADEDVCTSDQCLGGECVKGTRDTCEDNNSCTVDTCDALEGCKNELDEHLPNCNDGCTPGFWKANYVNKSGNAWPDGYTTKTIYDVFGTTALDKQCTEKGKNVSAFKSLGTVKLPLALSFKGGSDLNGKAQILLRAATAAVLNAQATKCLDSYPKTEAEIVTIVYDALTSCNPTDILYWATQLDTWNNAYNAEGVHCPIDQNGQCK